MTDYISEEMRGSGKINRRKPKKTSFRIQQIIDGIGEMLSAGRLDREIMEQLHVKRSQYYEYKSRLFQQSADLFNRLSDQNRESLIYHKELLSERLTRLYKQAELDLTQNKPAEVGINRASIYLQTQNIATNIFKLRERRITHLSKWPREAAARVFSLTMRKEA